MILQEDKGVVREMRAWSGKRECGQADEHVV